MHLTKSESEPSSPLFGSPDIMGKFLQRDFDSLQERCAPYKLLTSRLRAWSIRLLNNAHCNRVLNPVVHLFPPTSSYQFFSLMSITLSFYHTMLLQHLFSLILNETVYIFILGFFISVHPGQSISWSWMFVLSFF